MTKYESTHSISSSSEHFPVAGQPLPVPWPLHTMSHGLQETVLGKRKRREAASTTEKPQARIDHYFATKAPVKLPSNDNGHAHVSKNLVHTVQVRCDSAAVPQTGLTGFCTSQANSSKRQQQSQQDLGCLNQHEERAGCAADRQAAEALPTFIAQGEHLQEVKSAKATAFKASSKPTSATRNAQQLPSAAAAQPDLAEHLSFFLSILPERQQFRE